MFGSLKINNDTPAMPDMLTFTFEMIPSLPLSESECVTYFSRGLENKVMM